MRFAFKIAAVLVAVAVVISGIFLYVRNAELSLSGIGQTAQQPVGQVLLSVSSLPTAILSYGSASSSAIYSLVSYASSNATNATVTMSIYPKDPIAPIYLLNVSSYCVSCFSENQLGSDLESSLINYDLLRNSTSFSYINASSLSSIPRGSIVVIPSGLMPFFMLNGTQPMLLSLMQRGDTVIYAGLNFSSSIGTGGLIFVNPPSTMAALAASNLGTAPFNSSAKTEQANLSFSKPTFVFAEGSRYGNVTYASSGNGTLVAFSNYPTSSWVSASAMADDIAKAINASFWIQPLGYSVNQLDLASKSSGNLGVFAALSQAGNAAKSGSVMNINGSYTLITFEARNAQHFSVRKTVSQNFYVPKGSVSLPAEVGITQNIPILIQVLNESPNLLVHLDIYDLNSSYIGSIPIGFSNSPLGIAKYHAFTLPPGYYLLKLKDFNNNYYGGALFFEAGINITPTGLDFRNGTFSFSASSNGVPVQNATYTAHLNGLYGSSGSIANGAISYSLPKGTPISYGNEKFTFSIFNVNYTYSTVYQSSIANIPPIYIEFGIAAIVVLLLNLILKPPNRDEYYIDVPEFPPSKRERVRVSSSAVLGVFDKVNYYHHWKYMPLTAEELKLGIGNNIRSNNMPISITTQNAESAIASLVRSGSVIGAGGYYAPKAWIEASRHSIEYLTIFRKLRDYCVSHAILFTDLDSTDVADMLITKEGKQMSVFIYSSSEPMKKLKISRDSKSAIVFIDEEAMREFTKKLYDSFGKEAEVLKLSIEYNYVRLVDSDHLDQLAL
jgi:hypothetical protein